MPRVLAGKHSSAETHPQQPAPPCRHHHCLRYRLPCYILLPPPACRHSTPQTIAWTASPSPKECVKEYVIHVFASGDNSNIIKTATVPGTQTTYYDNQYVPSKLYEFQIYGRNPSLGASGNGIGMRSQPIQAPVAPATAVPL